MQFDDEFLIGWHHVLRLGTNPAILGASLVLFDGNNSFIKHSSGSNTS